MDRLDRERVFHNERFTEETLTAQVKYYWAVDHAYDRYKRLVQELSEDADIFELGCAKGENVFANPVKFRSASGIDISDVAIKIGNDQASAQGADNVHFLVGDAENIDLPAESLDLVYGSGIIHHLDVDRAARECHRLLRRGGKAVFWEPLGHNPAINLYRYLTPNARTEDEHPLLKSDIRNLASVFENVSLEFFGLTTLASVPFRNVPSLHWTRDMGIAIDKFLLALPAVRWMSWFVIIKLEKAPHASIERVGQ